MSWLFREVDHAKLYQKYRPVYPPGVYTTIFNYLESSGIKREATTGRFKLALDIGCGSGQSTLPLCDHFETVVGVDYSDAQLGEARLASRDRDNVTYRVALGHELSFVQDGSVDLITVATAIHWFDRERFYEECRRVLRPGGVLAAYSIGMVAASRPELEVFIAKLWKETLDDYWEPGIRQIYNSYKSLFEEFVRSFKHAARDDSFSIERDCNIEDSIGLLSTWSGYQKYRQLNPTLADPLVIMANQFKDILAGDTSDTPIHLSQSIFLLLGRN